MVRKVKSLPDVLLQKDRKKEVKDYLAGLPVSSRIKARLLMEWGKIFDVSLSEQDYIDVCGERVRLWK